MSFRKTEVGVIPFDWKIDTMENALEKIIDYRGKTPEKAEIGIKTLSAKSVKNGYIDYSQAYFISQETYKKFMVRGFPKKGDILLTTEAPLGLVAKLDRDKVGIAQRLLTLRGKENYLLNDFLMYYLMSKAGQHQLIARETGTTVKGIKQKEFRKCLISLPPIDEQKVIAHILSTLDGKIEVNNQINKKLEEMAQAIFKQWFVDYEFPNEDGESYQSSGGEMIESELGMIPKGWEVSSLSTVADITMGQSPKGTSYNEDGLGEVFYQGRTDFGDRFPVERLFTTEPKKMAKTGDILMSVRAPVGDINIAYENCCIGRGLCSINSKYDNNSYIYYLMMSLKEKLNVYNGEGTVFGSINKNTLSNITIVRPNNSVIDKFNKVASSLDEQYLCFIEQNRDLAMIRDTLLPKLMSGEIRVSTAPEEEVL